MSHTPPEDWKDVHFPRCGVDVSMAFGKQPARQGGDGQYSRTSARAVNVRSSDRSGRFRGGSRSGLGRYVNARVAGTEFIVQDLTAVTGVVYVEGDMQQSQTGRVVTAVAVAQGSVYTVNAGGTAWTSATNNTGVSPPLNYSGIVFSAVNRQVLYFADGVNYVHYRPSNNVLALWTATAGSMPEDSDHNKARLIETWRGRTMLSGLLLDPQNWFASAQDAPRDFNYSPTSQTPQQAVAGNNSPLGLIGDVITGMVPYNDDLLYFGGDHTIYMMQGDPMAGGQISQISGTIGMAWGRAWCLDPYGNCYFCSNRMGVYVMQPGQKPQRISYPIDSRLDDVDPGLNSIRLIWDDREQGFYVYITPLDGAAATTHWFYEQAASAWWPVEYDDDDMNPLVCCTFDGNLPTDRVTLLGSWDGYVRTISPEADDDDGTPIRSEVWIGPFSTQTFDDVLLKDVQAILAETSEDVTYEIYSGTTAEAALESEAVDSGTWEAGRNLSNLVRVAGHAIYVRISSTKQWAIEAIRLRIQGGGKVRRRGE